MVNTKGYVVTVISVGGGKKGEERKRKNFYSEICPSIFKEINYKQDIMYVFVCVCMCAEKYI